MKTRWLVAIVAVGIVGGFMAGRQVSTPFASTTGGGGPNLTPVSIAWDDFEISMNAVNDDVTFMTTCLTTNQVQAAMGTTNDDMTIMTTCLTTTSFRLPAF